MTTARKKARTAARQVDAQGDPQATTEQIADAASDVWEPLLRPFVEGEPYADLHDCGYMTCFFCLVDETEPWSEIGPDGNLVVRIEHKADCIWLRAKKALG